MGGDADTLIKKYTEESNADAGYSSDAKVALYLADRATHFSILANVAVVRAKNHHKESVMRTEIAKKACDKFMNTKLSKFENWLTSGEHGDEEANVAAMASVKEARKLTQESNELEVEAHKAIAAQQRSSRDVFEMEKIVADISRRADMDCKKAHDDETALEQQKQVSDGDSFLAGLEAAKVQAERDSKRSRKQCKRSRAEQLAASKRAKVLTEKHLKLTEEAEEAKSRAHAKRVETDKLVKDAMEKTKYANRRAHQETAAFEKAKKITCDKYHKLVEHTDNGANVIAATSRSAELLHKRALASRRNATEKFHLATEHHNAVARMKKEVAAEYLKVISFYKTWRQRVKQLVLAKDNLFLARRKEMTAIKNLPLRVRENLKKAYDMQLERATSAMKALKTHANVVIKDGNAAEKLRDEALQVDNRTLGLRRGIRKMEEQQAKRTEYMLKTILKNAKELKSGFKRAVPSDSQDDVGTGSTGATGSTGSTGNTGATGVSEYTASTGSTGITGLDDVTGSTGISGTTGTSSEEDGLTPAEKEVEEALDAAADKKASKLESESQIETEISNEVKESKKVGIKKSPLAHWLGGDALTDKHGCVVAAGDAWCSATKNCYSVSEPDTCPSALSTANVIREIYVADCPWCKKAKNESGKPKKLLFPGELEEARSTVDKHVLEWSKIVSHAQASAEALYSKSNETLDRLEVAVAHSNEMFTSEHAHQHLEHFMKRLESQAFNVSKAVKDVIAKRIASSKKAMLLKTKFIEEHSFANDTVMDNSTNGATGGATGGTGGATGGAAHKAALAHDSVAAFKVEKAALQVEISAAKAKYRDVEVNDTLAHQKLRLVEEAVRKAKSAKDLELVRMQFKAVQEIFDDDEHEDAATGGATGEEGDEDETGATGNGNATSLLKELESQKALVSSLKEKHKEAQDEWATAKDIMARDLAKKDQELKAQKIHGANEATGTVDISDEEVEEAIEGTSMLLHHVVPSKYRTAAKDFPTGNSTGNSTGNLTKAAPFEKNCTLSPMDKKAECKVFSVHGKNCDKDLSYTDAQAVCEEKGAHVCSQAELLEAFKSGYESTACGWTSTETTMGHLVEMVLSEDRPDIEGKKGFNVCALEKNLENTYGVHCCGV